MNNIIFLFEFVSLVSFTVFVIEFKEKEKERERCRERVR